MMRTIGLSEGRVVEVWKSIAGNACRLMTVDNKPVNILYPGRPSSNPGSDFEDAVVEHDGEVRHGNIEVHVRSGDWLRHGHHQDTAYNGVILHVVMDHQGAAQTTLENGACVPTVALREYTESYLPGGPRGLPCLTGDVALAAIEKAGEARFREKAELFLNVIEKKDAGQCLYCGMMAALGYSHNKEPFRRLADTLPLSLLESPPAPDPSHLEALFFGAAGFLPSQRSVLPPDSGRDPYVREIERRWRKTGLKTALSMRDWRLCRVRPPNYPPRRLAAMAHLLWQVRNEGLTRNMVGLVERAPPEKPWQYMENVLMVETDGYWKDRFDFGKVSRGLTPYLIGQARAAEIVLNVLLPFAFSVGARTSDIRLAEKAEALYHSYPVSGENAIERHMRSQLSVGKRAIDTACRQQGLLHLYKRFCTRGRCTECPLMDKLQTIKNR